MSAHGRPTNWSRSRSRMPRHCHCEDAEYNEGDEATQMSAHGRPTGLDRFKTNIGVSKMKKIILYAVAVLFALVSFNASASKQSMTVRIYYGNYGLDMIHPMYACFQSAAPG